MDQGKKRDLIQQRLDEIKQAGGSDAWRRLNPPDPDCEDRYREMYKDFDREYSESLSSFI